MLILSLGVHNYCMHLFRKNYLHF
uniref:Uncharacterized protein n=1 Tax=Anguilla anguilla TaxID=7936 RepID=A0A0E9XQJ2_ANGAN